MQISLTFRVVPGLGAPRCPGVEPDQRRHGDITADRDRVAAVKDGRKARVALVQCVQRTGARRTSSLNPPPGRCLSARARVDRAKSLRRLGLGRTYGIGPHRRRLGRGAVPCIAAPTGRSQRTTIGRVGILAPRMSSLLMTFVRSIERTHIASCLDFLMSHHLPFVATIR